MPANECNTPCPPAGGGGELLHQAGGQAEGGVPEGEGEGPHQATGHGLRHLPKRGHDGHVSQRPVEAPHHPLTPPTNKLSSALSLPLSLSVLPQHPEGLQCLPGAGLPLPSGAAFFSVQRGAARAQLERLLRPRPSEHPLVSSAHPDPSSPTPLW